MAKKDTKNNKKGGNIKPIEEMVATQDSNAEKFLDKLEKLEENSKKDEPIVDEMVEQIEQPSVEQTVEPIDEPIPEAFDYSNINMEEVQETDRLNVYQVTEEQIILHERMKRLNINIKNAIYYNKGKSTKGIIGGQYKAILKNYKNALGVDMSEEQASYMKKLNIEQAKSVIYTINMFIKWEKNLQLTEAVN